MKQLSNQSHMKAGLYLLGLMMVLAQLFIGWPIVQPGSVSWKLQPERVKAANFTFTTGYYVGDGVDNLAITGLGFQPDFVMIKDDTVNGDDGVNFKTSSMSGEVSSVLADADGDTTNNAIQSLDSDGFTVGTDIDVNTSNVGFSWQAFGGSNCTSSGTFCVGSYDGNGTSQSITAVGFLPDFLIIKRSGASLAVFKTTGMGTNNTAHFDSTAMITANTAIRSLDATGFTVGNGAQVNTSLNKYYYVAFKAITNRMVTGSYPGDVNDNRDITGFGSGYTPNFVITKSGSTQSAVYNAKESIGDYSYDFLDVSSAANMIQRLQDNGFQVGTSAKVNGSGVTFYWVGFGEATYTPYTTTYDIQTGYYVGNQTDNRVITGIGFRPDLVFLKSSTTATTMRWKSLGMTREQTIGTVTAAVATDQIQTLNANGFTLGASSIINANNVIYYYIAIKGSGCLPGGMMCIGTYVGNGVTARVINTVGFQPNFVMTKAVNTTSTAAWKTSSMGTNVNQWLAATAETTDGTGMQALTSTGFTVGTSAGTNAINVPYWFIAFKNTTDVFNVGMYSGDGSDPRNITGFGSGDATPNFVFVKGTGAVNPVGNIRECYGESAIGFAALANIVDSVTALIPNGFEVGNETTTNTVNTSGSTYYWVMFGGASTSPPNGSGNFTMAGGMYTANNGVAFNVTGLGFAPDLVIVKGNNTQVAVFRTSIMGGDSTAHMSSATANFTGGITSLGANGFSIGTSTIVNPLNTTDIYYWEAFGNAFKPDLRTGAANFAIGAYYGNGIDSRNIVVTGIDPDLVTIKRSGASAGVWSTATIGSDNTLAFAATANTADIIQQFNSDGFQIGTNATANSAASVMWWFAFKETANLFDIDVYRGNGSNARLITTVGFQPELVWIKKYGATARAAVMRPNYITGDSTQQFDATANAANKIKALETNGFQVGSDNTVNESGASTAFDYYYAAWNNPAATLAISGPTTLTLASALPGETKDTTFPSEFTITDAGNGWSLTTVMTSTLTSGQNTIPTANVKLRKDGIVGGSDTYTIWGGIYTNVTETDTTQSLDIVRTVGTRSSGFGAEQTTVRPSIQVTIPIIQAAGNYTGTIRFTIA